MLLALSPPVTPPPKRQKGVADLSAAEHIQALRALEEVQQAAAKVSFSGGAASLWSDPRFGGSELGRFVSSLPASQEEGQYSSSSTGPRGEKPPRSTSSEQPAGFDLQRSNPGTPPSPTTSAKGRKSSSSASPHGGSPHRC